LLQELKEVQTCWSGKKIEDGVILDDDILTGVPNFRLVKIVP
jgi:hypothetical protein